MPAGGFRWRPSGEIRWYSPDPRGILPLDAVHIPRRLARVARQGRFRIEVDRAFVDVMRACAADERDPDDPGTWISDEIIESYTALHEAGIAHSVEAWIDDRLVGGLYGVALRGAFFGESMFHRETDASKVALVALVERLRGAGLRAARHAVGHPAPRAVRGGRDSAGRTTCGASSRAWRSTAHSRRRVVSAPYTVRSARPGRSWRRSVRRAR